MVELAINIVSFVICSMAVCVVSVIIWAVFKEILNIYREFAHWFLDFVDNVSEKIRKMMGAA